MITQERLKELLQYNPETGEFIRVKRLGGRASVGQIVGSYTDKGYLRTKLDGVSYALHRLAFLWMTGSFPSNEVDHINNKRDDNRWINLRTATSVQNSQNRITYSSNLSGIKGISWNKRYNHWLVRITVDRKCLHLGCFKTLKDAEEVIAKAREELHGEFAKS